MDRRAFLKGLVATAAGVLVPGQVLAEPERRVWALDRTMMLETDWFDADPRFQVDTIALTEADLSAMLGEIYETYRIPNTIIVSQARYHELRAWIGG